MADRRLDIDQAVFATVFTGQKWDTARVENSKNWQIIGASGPKLADGLNKRNTVEQQHLIDQFRPMVDRLLSRLTTGEGSPVFDLVMPVTLNNGARLCLVWTPNRPIPQVFTSPPPRKDQTDPPQWTEHHNELVNSRLSKVIADNVHPADPTFTKGLAALLHQLHGPDPVPGGAEFFVNTPEIFTPPGKKPRYRELKKNFSEIARLITGASVEPASQSWIDPALEVPQIKLRAARYNEYSDKINGSKRSQRIVTGAGVAGGAATTVGSLYYLHASTLEAINTALHQPTVVAAGIYTLATIVAAPIGIRHAKDWLARRHVAKRLAHTRDHVAAAAFTAGVTNELGPGSNPLALPPAETTQVSTGLSHQPTNKHVAIGPRPERLGDLPTTRAGRFLRRFRKRDAQR